MLRLFVLVLVLANIGFYAWTQGMLDGVVGARPTGDREPERMAKQVNPDAVRVLPPVSAVAVTEAAPACLEAGPYTPAQIAAAEGVLQTVLPAVGFLVATLLPALIWRRPRADRGAVHRRPP